MTVHLALFEDFSRARSVNGGTDINHVQESYRAVIHYPAPDGKDGVMLAAPYGPIPEAGLEQVFHWPFPPPPKELLHEEGKLPKVMDALSNVDPTRPLANILAYGGNAISSLEESDSPTAVSLGPLRVVYGDDLKDAPIPTEPWPAP